MVALKIAFCLYIGATLANTAHCILTTWYEWAFNSTSPLATFIYPKAAICKFECNRFALTIFAEDYIKLSRMHLEHRPHISPGIKDIDLLNNNLVTYFHLHVFYR